MSGRPIVVAGVDLSGPANPADTALSLFVREADALRYLDHQMHLDDRALVAALRAVAPRRGLCVGLDAPLSYQPGGGDRPGDRELRRRIVAAGLHPGSVMTPTMTRMAYLTLRGISLSRALRIELPHGRVVEVHPGATLVLRGASPADVRALKRSPAARARLRTWLATQGLKELPGGSTPGDHLVASWAAALCTWTWHENRSAWIMPAAPPTHPFDFAA